ncbi:AmmeMemoRadiSam system protein A [Patescibacteria group bacterium]|nr:AmmeMemoRadiSam system protein A [Patescibacteria group bacterium]
MLSKGSRKKLLEIARRSIAAQLENRRFEMGKIAEELKKIRATFVTLTKNKELRGCIGSLEARQTLVEDVRQNAITAAFGDPRFPPLSSREFAEIKIEISILTPPRDLEYSNAADLLAKLRAGKDGVILSSGWNSATFLPQVWKELQRKEEFLGSLCVKAGLPFNAWRSGKLKIQIYEAEKFGERLGKRIREKFAQF